MKELLNWLRLLQLECKTWRPILLIITKLLHNERQSNIQPFQKGFSRSSPSLYGQKIGYIRCIDWCLNNWDKLCPLSYTCNNSLYNFLVSWVISCGVFSNQTILLYRNHPEKCTNRPGRYHGDKT